MPSHGHFERPPGFASPRYSSPAASESSSVQEKSLETASEEAMEEWQQILRVFQDFERWLIKPESKFGPVASAHVVDPTTPFGTALSYRSNSIAGIWMNYYVGCIILQRCHPHMPPAAMAAAAKAAGKTALFAGNIARIAAGLRNDAPDRGRGQIGLALGSAFIESSFCLFVAGVQVSYVVRLQYLSWPPVSHLSLDA